MSFVASFLQMCSIAQAQITITFALAVGVLAHHAVLLYEHAGPLQCALLGLATASVIALRFRKRTIGVAIQSHDRWMLSSIYLTAVVAGLHPTKGYWLYPVSLLLIAIGAAMEQIRCKKVYQLLFVAGCLWLFVPGTGLRSTWTYLRHYGDARYDGSRFIAQVLSELPEDGLYMADLSYVFDVYLSGRETRLCKNVSSSGAMNRWTMPTFCSLGRERCTLAQQYDASLLRSKVIARRLNPVISTSMCLHQEGVVKHAYEDSHATMLMGR